MAKVVFRGHAFDDRTVKMIEWAEKEAGFKFKIVKGSYLPADDKSASTHCGGGAVDFSTKILLPAKRDKMLNALKDAGFAAWYRTKADGFDPHIHAVAIGCMDLDPMAKRQVTSYDKHENGLGKVGPDKTYRPKPPVKFDLRKGEPVPRVKK